MAKEYISVPAMAMEDPMIDPVLMGVLKAMTEATMMTTRLMVFPTAWVTGFTYIIKERQKSKIMMRFLYMAIIIRIQD